jgi:hypothetical protein
MSHSYKQMELSIGRLCSSKLSPDIQARAIAACKDYEVISAGELDTFCKGFKVLESKRIRECFQIRIESDYVTSSCMQIDSVLEVSATMDGIVCDSGLTSGDSLESASSTDVNGVDDELDEEDTSPCPIAKKFPFLASEEELLSSLAHISEALSSLNALICVAPDKGGGLCKRLIACKNALQDEADDTKAALQFPSLPQLPCIVKMTMKPKEDLREKDRHVVWDEECNKFEEEKKTRAQNGQENNAMNAGKTRYNGSKACSCGASLENPAYSMCKPCREKFKKDEVQVYL